MEPQTIGIDLGKTTFHLVALSAAGKVLVRKKFTQKQRIMLNSTVETSLIGVEERSGTHLLGCAFRAQGPT